MLDTDPSFRLVRDRAGHFTITPDGLTEARQRYEPDTGTRASPAFSHIGVIAGGVTPARALAATGGHASTAGAPP
jgi:hypothetical protein